MCSWAGHFTLTVPLSTQVPIYQWVPSDLMLGVTLRWTSIPSRVEEKCSLSLHATETWISSGLMGHLARMQNLLHSFKTELATDLHPVASYTSTNAILSQFVWSGRELLTDYCGDQESNIPKLRSSVFLYFKRTSLMWHLCLDLVSGHV